MPGARTPREHVPPALALNGRRRLPDPGQVHQVHDGRGVRASERRARREATRPCRRASQLPPRRHVCRQHRPDVVRAGADHDDHQRRTALDAGAQRATDQRLPVELASASAGPSGARCLRPAGPAGYRTAFTTVTGT
jgi:hypothetical protein